jgi:hypothetical protein
MSINDTATGGFIRNKQYNCQQDPCSAAGEKPDVNPLRRTMLNHGILQRIRELAFRLHEPAALAFFHSAF